MIDQDLRSLKVGVFGLIALFLLLFSSSFWPVPSEHLEKFFFILVRIILLVHFLAGISLIVQIFGSGVEGKLKSVLLLTGFSSVLFSLGVLNGFLAMRYYSFPEWLFFLSTLGPMVGFLIGSIGSLVLFRR